MILPLFPQYGFHLYQSLCIVQTLGIDPVVWLGLKLLVCCFQEGTFQYDGDLYLMCLLVQCLCGDTNRPILVVAMWYGSRQHLDVVVVVCDSQDGLTALMWAVRNGHTSTVALLLEKGAPVDQADKVRLFCLPFSSAQIASVHVRVLCANPLHLVQSLLGNVL